MPLRLDLVAQHGLPLPGPHDKDNHLEIPVGGGGETEEEARRRLHLTGIGQQANLLAQLARRGRSQILARLHLAADAHQLALAEAAPLLTQQHTAASFVDGQNDSGQDHRSVQEGLLTPA